MPADEAAAALLAPGWRDLDVDGAVAAYRRDGFALVPGVAAAATLEALRARVDDLMLGRLDPAPFFFQADAASGAYGDAPLGEGWTGPSLRYRKMEKLERDPLFRAWLENPLFERIARAVVGPEVALYRAIVMTKAARDGAHEGGTVLPWHQDGGRLWGLARDPELQLWTALDDAPAEAGCMRIAAGSHRAGLATALGGAIPADVVAGAEPDLDVRLVAAAAGDVVLLHNMVWHRSERNATDRPRRAFSVCFIDAANRCIRTRRAPRAFARVW